MNTNSGRIYTVIEIANVGSYKPEYPVTVVYKGDNGKVWAKTMQRFHTTMRFTGETHVEPVKDAFVEGYTMANERMTWDANVPCWGTVQEAWVNSDAHENSEGE